MNTNVTEIISAILADMDLSPDTSALNGQASDEPLGVKFDGNAKLLLETLKPGAKLKIGENQLRYDATGNNDYTVADLWTFQQRHLVNFGGTCLTLALGSINTLNLDTGFVHTVPVLFAPVVLHHTPRGYEVEVTTAPHANASLSRKLSIAPETLTLDARLGDVQSPSDSDFNSVAPTIHLIVGDDREQLIRERLKNIASAPSSAVTALYGVPNPISSPRTPPTRPFKPIKQLDSVQAHAVEKSRAGHSFRIEGPPGSGKTQTILNIIAAAVQDQRRALLVAPYPHQLQSTLMALIDSKLDQYVFCDLPPDSFTGIPGRLLKTLCQPGATIPQILITTIDRFATTGSPDWRFDIVIVEEATLAPINLGLIPIAAGDTVIVAGDLHQIQTRGLIRRSASTPGQYTFIENVHSTARRYGMDVVQLYRHYRSRHPSLIEISSRLFYSCGLATPPSPHQPPNKGRNYHFIENGRLNADLTNPIEAKSLVAAYIEFAGRRTGQTTAIIGNGAPQTRLISNEIARQSSKIPADTPEPILLYAHAAQGAEADVVFISMTAGLSTDDDNPNHALHLTSPGGPSILNVMLSRARDRMDIFSSINPEMFRDITHPDFLALSQFATMAPQHAITSEPTETKTPLTDTLSAGGYSTKGWENTTLVYNASDRPVAAIQHTGSLSDYDEKSQRAQLIYNGWAVISLSEAALTPDHPEHGETVKALFAFLKQNRNRHSKE